MKVATQKISFENGKSMTARWLSMGTEELFLQKDAAVLLNVTVSTISECIKTHSLDSFGMAEDVRNYLVKTNIIDKRDGQSKLLPRATVDALVKIVNTTEAWAIWAQILNAVRNPTANIALQQEIGGLDQVAQVMNEAIAVMAVSIDRQSELVKLCEDKLRANNITPFGSKYIGSVYHNGTLNSFYKHLNSKFAPVLAEDLSGRDFFTRVLHADNYNEICDYVRGMEMSEGLLKTLKSVQKHRLGLISPAVNGRGIHNTRRGDR